MKHTLLLQESTSFEDAVSCLDQGGMGFLALVDESGVLKGVLTDGDIRRAILKKKQLLAEIINTSPVTLHKDISRTEAIRFLQSIHRRHLPLVDDDGKLVEILFLEDLTADIRPNSVVIMAGGLGSRLSPLTDNCPKPMLRVGGRPILETILKNLVFHGFKKIYISVNYMAETIMDYFGDGTRFGVEICYLQETKRMGTAGALSLLLEQQISPFIVMNGDILSTVNYPQLLEFHQHHAAVGTMCVREYDFQVPYGVVNVDQHNLVSIEEKPVHNFFVNAGIYVFSPEILELIPMDQPSDMPAIFQKLLQQGEATAVFPLREYWLDLGHIEDLTRARKDFSDIFPGA